MKISYNWLKEFIDLKLSPEETAEKLTLIGLEVESVTDFGHALKGVVVGEVLEVSDHKNADRLRLCKVNVGKKTVQIVCGAKNVAAGQKVPVATVGSTLPPTDESAEPFEIKEATLRGEVSKGMICAEDELGLGRDHSGIMVLDDSLQTGAPLKEALDLYQDTIIDIELTPNRPDATCHLGVARDLAAALNLTLTKPFTTEFEESESLPKFDIRIKNPKKCPRYVGKIVKNVAVGQSPAWLRNKLKAVGVRPVNNVVDATNFVMYELGQPLHAFDRKALQGDKIVVQDFDETVSFETLDHTKRDCPPGTLFICDGKKPVAIAGVMGGVNTEVSEHTHTIFIESAYFNPATIRKTASGQALQTDASYRYERGIDPQMQRIAAERAAELIAQTTGGTITPYCTDVRPHAYEPNVITLRKSYVNRLLGTDLSADEIAQLLNGLELNIQKQDEASIRYEIPSFRPDLQREVDLIEEVGRLYDYNRIPAPAQHAFISPAPIPAWEQLNTNIKEVAKGLRFREIYSNSLISEQDAQKITGDKTLLHTLNPGTADMTTLRPSLMHGFLQSAAYNFNRNATGVRFFETGHVFSESTNGTYYAGIHEQVNLLFGLAGLKQIEHWNTKETYYSIFDLKAVVNSFLQALDLQHVATIEATQTHLDYFIGDQKIGRLQSIPEPLRTAYELEVPAFTAEFSISQLYEHKQQSPERSYQPVSKFPAFDFDFGVIVEKSVPAAALLKTITREAGALLDEIDIFDVFEGKSLGENKKNIAFRLSFLDKKKTLTIKDVEPIIEKVLNVLDDQFSAKLRNS